MRERVEGGVLGLDGPITRSREQGIRHQPFAVDVMDSDIVPSPGAVAGEMEPLGDNGRVLVSEPLQRNLEATRMYFLDAVSSLPVQIFMISLFSSIDYLSDDQPARICQRIRGNASSTTPGSPMSTASSTIMLQNISNRSPTRRAAASSSCPSPLSLEKDTTEATALLTLNKNESLDGKFY